MNLKTHTAYPEIHIHEDFSFSAKLFDGKGVEKFALIGEGKDHSDARAQACKAIDAEANKYLIKAGVKS